MEKKVELKTDPRVELLDATDLAEAKIVSIAKLSHGGDIHKVYSSEEVANFIDKLMKWKHFSVFEHAYATFYISDISLNASHQLVRHRLFSFLQVSRRYSTADPEFVLPETVRDSKIASESVTRMYKSAMDMYVSLVDSGVPKEDARFVLPSGLTTSIVVTGNFREWMHFLKLRLSEHAQWEIREVAEQVLKMLNLQAPTIFNLHNLTYYFE